MKRIVFLGILVSTFFIGCDTYTNNYLLENAKGHELYYNSEFDNLVTEYDINQWWVDRTDYELDYGKGSWKNPEDFLLSGKGDCEDYVLAFMNTYYFVTGIKTKLGAVDMNTEIVIARAIENGGKPNHAVVVLPNGSKFDCIKNRFVEVQLMYTIEFNEIFS